MKLIYRYIVTFMILLVFLQTAKPCTVLYATDGTRVLAATNKDWNNLNTAIRVMPTSEGKFGRIYFGYNIPEGFQNVGGVNEYGLWYDGASLPGRSDIANHYNKPEYNGELCEKALEECQTVEEVIGMYSQYYSPHWQGHIMWGDKYGNSVVIEFGEKDVCFIYRKESFQLMTNHYLLDSINTRWVKCRRYETAKNMLGGYNNISVDKLVKVLNAVHQNGFTPTLFSNVYDLTNGIVYIYNYHRYTEVVKIDIAALLNWGDQNIHLPGLFHQVELNDPVNGSQVNYENSTLSWSGEPGLYRVMYSRDPDFDDCIIIDEYEKYQGKSNTFYPGLLLAPLMLCVFSRKNFRQIQNVFLVVTSIILISVSCTKTFLNPYPDSEYKHSVEIQDLEPETTYYWKVICENNSIINSESEVQFFETIK
jgi:hypothetical protein